MILSEELFEPLVDQTFSDADTEWIRANRSINWLHFGLGIPAPTNEDIDKELKRLDTNKDGKVSKTELVKELALHCLDAV